MARTPEYEQLRQQADALYEKLKHLPEDASEDEIKSAHAGWIELYGKALLRHFPVESVAELEDFAGEGIKCIQKSDEMCAAYPNILPQQPETAKNIYKKADGYAYDLSKANGWPPLIRCPQTLYTIDELRAIQKWCLERTRFTKEDSYAEIDFVSQTIVIGGQTHHFKAPRIWQFLATLRMNTGRAAVTPRDDGENWKNAYDMLRRKIGGSDNLCRLVTMVNGGYVLSREVKVKQ